MSSLLYLLSYSLYFCCCCFVPFCPLFSFFFLVISLKLRREKGDPTKKAQPQATGAFFFFFFCFCPLFLSPFVFFLRNADRGIAPLFTGHEPGMLLLHQSALITVCPLISFFFFCPLICPLFFFSP